jgi:uncharacterized membrane protein HdeD (DUF308 family)
MRAAQGIARTGWHIFAGVLSAVAGVVVIALPISSIVVLAIVAGHGWSSSGPHKLCGP